MKKIFLIISILATSVFADTGISNENNQTNVEKQCVRLGNGRGATIRYKRCLKKQRQKAQNNEIKG